MVSGEATLDRKENETIAVHSFNYNQNMDSKLPIITNRKIARAVAGKRPVGAAYDPPCQKPAGRPRAIDVEARIMHSQH
jgi:hypothetical protein